MRTRNNLFASVILFSLMFFSVNSSHAQTNFFYYHGEKVILNVKTSQISIIFSESTTKSNARDLLSKYDIKGDMEQIKNVALAAFYILKFNKQKDIQNIITKLKSEEDIIWVNPVFERKGTEFKVYNRFVVKITPNVFSDQIETLNQKHHVKFIRQSGTGRYTFELTGHSGLSVMDMTNLYYQELQAEWAAPDFIVPFEFYSTVYDEYYPFQFNYNNTGQEGGTPDADIDAPQAWGISKGSSDIIVAVIDNGVEVHPDLPAERLVEGYNAYNPLLDTEPHKNEAHGMACAGLIAASHNSIGIAGLAPECKIMPIQHSGADGKITSLDNIAAAFEYAWDIGDADIISNSWGGEHDVNEPTFVTLREAIEEAMSLGRNGKGCVVLFASGNDYANYIKNTMATIEGVIAVGASNKNDYKTSYSNSGEELDVVAPSADDGLWHVSGGTCPGTDTVKYIIYESRGNIWTIDIENIGGYNISEDFCPESHNRYIQAESDESGDYTGHFGGTSAACPQVAGLAALILSVNENLYYHEVENIIRNTADKIHPELYNYNWNPATPGHSKEVGYGRVNAFKALKYISPTYNSVSGTISSNTTWSGYKYVIGNVTVNSGVTLTIEPGTVILFYDDKLITVNGALTASGSSSEPIIFTSINQNPAATDWCGIKIYGAANIDHAIIKYAQKGIQFYANSSGTVSNSELLNNSFSGVYIKDTVHPEVAYCQIHNNGSYGIYVYNSNSNSEWLNLSNNSIYDNNYCGIHLSNSSPFILSNEIYNHDYGVIAVTNSSPYLGNYGEYGNNDIHNNVYGVASSVSNPFLGEEACTIHGGNNQITSNSSYNIKAINNSYVQAELNWWGFYPPHSSDFYTSGSSIIDYTPALSSPPDFNKSSGDSPEESDYDSEFPSDENSFSSESDYMQYYDSKWPLERKLIFARDIFWLGDIKGSQSICKDVMEFYPDSSLAFFALDILWQSSRNAEPGSAYDLESFKKYLLELSSKKEKKPLYGYSDIIYAGFESDKSLISSCDKIYNEYKDTFLPKIALYKKFIYYYNEQNDLEKAKEAVDQLQHEYPNSLETESAMSHFNDKKSSLAKSSFSDESLNNKSSTLPDKYALTSNYPNPFNPTTSIEFSLPKNSKADIVIYNSLGQFVRKVSYNLLPAGIHTYFWDGKNENGINMSSGLYILHFSAQSLEEDKETFSKSIKMLLIR